MSMGADPVLTELRARPSILGEIDVGNGCPVSVPQRVMGTTFSALGSEPLYAGGLNAKMERSDTIEVHSDRYVAVDWLSEPTNRHSLLVKGINLESGAPIEFRSPEGELSDELYLSTATSTEAGSVGPDFRTWPTRVSVPMPACYAMQVEGIGHFGGYAIVFEVNGP